jgi:dTDP-4-dehydrorhamnose 3,5-epimerase-like enzyme
VPHEDGHVTEVARASWSELVDPVVQVHLTTTFPGRVRVWGLHQASTDRLFVVSGLVKIVVFDGRHDSASFGRMNEVVLSEKNPGLLIVPPNLYHGWKNRDERGHHHQHADQDVSLRGPRRPRSTLGLRSRCPHYPLSLLTPPLGDQ